MQKVTLSLLCLFGYVFCFGQALDQSFTNSKWEIGVDLLRFVELNTVPKESIFFRRKIMANNALRTRVGMTREYFTYYRVTSNSDTFRTVAPYLSLGYEWQIPVEKFRYHFSTDIFGEYFSKNNRYLIGSGTFSHDTITQRVIGLTASIGFQYRLYKNLHIAYELSAQAKYTQNRSDSREWSSNGTSWAWGGAHWNKFDFRLQPISTLQLIFLIPKKLKT